MTATDLAQMSQQTFKKRNKAFGSLSVQELESVKTQAYEAMRTVGDSPKFNPVSEFTGNSYNTLELTAKLAEAYIEMKQGR